MTWRDGTNEFRCPVTGFAVTKPSHWYFMPGPWMKPGQDRLVAPSEAGQAALAVNPGPLVAFRFDHDVAGEVRPTAQVRRRGFPLDISLTDLVASHRASLPTLFHELDLLELTDTAVLAGCRGIRFQAEHTAISKLDDGEQVRCRCRVTSHAIRLDEYLVTLSVTTPVTPALRADADVEAIFASARVGYDR